jgi:colanic acid biosynthesis glycosyl transferase WcaI
VAARSSLDPAASRLMGERSAGLHIQLWSWNFEPEWTAMGPIATMWAREMARRGHTVEVIAAHPHYPPDVWRQRLRPRRRRLDGVTVIRLPLWIGHGTATQRVREELTFAASATVAAALVRTPDVTVAVSPSFLALGPLLMNAKIRRCPWILWLQDIIPDAALTTGIVDEGLAIRCARLLESTAYRAAARIVVISDSFAENLHAKGVGDEQITRIYNPATHEFVDGVDRLVEEPPRILYMGNMGFSQGLVEFVRAFQEADAMGGAKLVIAGSGEFANDVRDAITSDRVEFLGLLTRDEIDAELRRASCGLVTQRAEIEEFNVPSKLMNLMAKGLPVWAHVRPGSEVSRVVAASGGGWVSSSADSTGVASVLGRIVGDASERAVRGERALGYARAQFHPTTFADRFEAVLAEVARRRGS